MSCSAKSDKTSRKEDKRHDDRSRTSSTEGTDEKYSPEEEGTGNSDAHKSQEDTQEKGVEVDTGHDSDKSATFGHHGSPDGSREKKGDDVEHHPSGESEGSDDENGDFIYVFGGCKGEREIPVERYNIAKNKWKIVESEGDVPIAGCSYEASVAVWHKDAVWLSGGLRNGRPTDKFYRYDPREKTWREKNPMIEPRVRHGMAVILDKLHVFGGFNGQEVKSTAEYYDEHEDTWKRCKRRMKQARSQFGVTIYDGRIAVAGGGFRCKALTTFECFDGEVWRPHAWIFFSDCRCGLKLCTTDETVFTVGGNIEKNINTVLWFDDPNSTFQEMRYPLGFLSNQRNIIATVHRDVLYVINIGPESEVYSTFSSCPTAGKGRLSSRICRWIPKRHLISKRLFPAIVVVQL